MNERIRTIRGYNLDCFDWIRAADFYEMPIIKAESYIPDELIGFNYALTTKRRNAGIHFFIDDYQFERVWNEPQRYLPILGRFPCVLTPDFSLYMDMPMAMKIWNTYRSRLIGQMMQDYGIRVVPTLSWAEPETFSFCFDGIEPHGCVAVSTVGTMNDDHAQMIWKQGMTEAINRLRPMMVLCYGLKPDYDFGTVPVKYFKPREFKKGRKTWVEEAQAPGGGSGSSRVNMNDYGSVQAEINRLGDKMYSLTRQTDPRTAQMTPEARKEYLKTLDQRNSLRNRLRTMKNPEASYSDSVPKTFVNSFGEATSRKITSQTYENAMRRQEKDVLKNMGF